MNSISAPAVLKPTTVAEIQSAVLDQQHLFVRGGGTKPALSVPGPDSIVVDMSGLTGILEYNPSEYTFTAWAGTPVSHIQQALAEHGQYLPFDPLFVEEGATLGGSVASGLSGPGRYRYGGVRDFILGVRLIDGQGRLLRGGGKVVKNAAGFDFPKLMVGSLGMFGVMTELSFKVFPRPPASLTLSKAVTPMPAAMACLNQLYNSRADIDALDFEPLIDGLKLFVRIRGLPDALPGRAERLQALLGQGGLVSKDEDYWRQSYSSTDADFLIKVALTSANLREVEAFFEQFPNISRCYSVGGNVLWLRGSQIPAALPSFLESHKLSALVVKGPPPVRLGYRSGPAFETRIKHVFDPHSRFPFY